MPDRRRRRMNKKCLVSDPYYFKTKPDYCKFGNVNETMTMTTVMMMMMMMMMIMISLERVVRGPGYRSRRCDILVDGRSGDQIPEGAFFLHPPRPAVEPTQHPIQWAPGFSSPR